VNGESFNLGFEKSFGLKELLEKMCQNAGVKREI
jgi:hypothetical protein